MNELQQVEIATDGACKGNPGPGGWGAVLRFGATRTNVGLDLYNLFNANTGTAFNQGFGDGSSWLRPTTIMNPRFVRFNVTFDF